MTARTLSMLALALATALGYLYFPGHHYLQQDTQIWLPVLAHAQDPTLFRQELIVTGAHIRLTIFDDVTLALVSFLGLSFETALAAQQLIFRFLALWGVWLLARATGLSHTASVLAATVCGMGATIIGPAVLTVEYEPVPRGFAFGLTLFALGLMSHQRYLLSGMALGLAFAYHAPVIWPVLLVAGWVLVSGKKSMRMTQAPAMAGFAIFIIVLAISTLMSETGPMNPLFARLTPSHAELQRMRASYNWITLWAAPETWILQYATMAFLGGLAFWRLRRSLPSAVKPYLLALPAIGLLSIPLSYLLLEQAQLALIPQVQIMRSLIFTFMVGLILSVLAGLRAASEGRWWEAPWWLGLPLFVPMAPVWRGRPGEVYLVMLVLVVVATVALTLEKRHARLALAGAALFFAGCFFAPSGLASYRNYTSLGDDDLARLVSWAKSHSGKDDVFLFRDIGKRTEPGLFRARALRAVYVDWKGGGQVNYYEFYANEWWRRWRQFMEPAFRPADLPELRKAGIRYLVFRKAPKDWDQGPVYENPGYRVYRID